MIFYYWLYSYKFFDVTNGKQDICIYTQFFTLSPSPQFFKYIYMTDDKTQQIFTISYHYDHGNRFMYQKSRENAVPLYLIQPNFMLMKRMSARTWLEQYTTGWINPHVVTTFRNRYSVGFGPWVLCLLGSAKLRSH